MNIYRVYPHGIVQDTARERVPFVGAGFDSYDVIQARSETEARAIYGQRHAKMKDPNNVRNRWRRYRETMAAYGWTAEPFRTFARTRDADTYGAFHGARNEQVALTACRCPDVFPYICLCKVTR